MPAVSKNGGYEDTARHHRPGPRGRRAPATALIDVDVAANQPLGLHEVAENFELGGHSPLNTAA